MPGGDRTGPGGMGPMTGRGAGFCAGYPTPGYANPMGGRGYGFGFGRGWGRGGGWGRRNWYHATGLTGWQRAGYGYPQAVPYPAAAPAYPTAYQNPYAPALGKDQELDMLKSQAEYLDDQLSGINKRIGELEAEQKEKKK